MCLSFVPPYSTVTTATIAELLKTFASRADSGTTILRADSTTTSAPEVANAGVSVQTIMNTVCEKKVKKTRALSSIGSRSLGKVTEFYRCCAFAYMLNSSSLTRKCGIHDIRWRKISKKKKHIIIVPILRYLAT